MTVERTALPTGTVTFLRSDIEQSMMLARLLGAEYDVVNADHQVIVRQAIAEHGGIVVRTEGDAFFAVFRDGPAAVAAAVQIQRRIADHPWPAGATIRVRIGLHSGSAHRAGDDYGGFDVNRAARIAAAGSGGQIVVSDSVRALVAGSLPDGSSIRDLGRHRLKDVAEPEHLFQVDVPGLPSRFPALRGTVGGAGNLPDRLTSFLGRAADLEQLERLLAGSRLVTLTGPGGAGKTSLAIELGRRVEGGFPDGVWLVDLSAVRDTGLVKPTIARTVGLHDGVTGPAADRLEGHLADQSALLILDNFEQILDAAPVVASIVRAAPAVTIIVASRAPLRLSGEQEFAVGPLGTDGHEGAAVDHVANDAVRLFVDRGRSVRPNLEITSSDEQVISEICALLDGLPLGIELAAARVGALPISVIRDRLAARLPLPGSGPRDLPARQRTLEDTIGWSYDLLEPPARRLFEGIAVFVGSFELTEAEAVCGPAEELGADVLDVLVGLAEHSLLAPVEADGDAGIRFRALETVRASALSRLRASGNEATFRRRHAEAYAGLAARVSPHLPGADQARLLDRLAVDNANLLEALGWAIEAGATEMALHLVADLWRYWLMSGRLQDGRQLVERVLALSGADRPTAARVRALDAAGGVAYWNADTGRAERLYREQLSIAKQLDLRWEIANATLNLAYVSFAKGDEAASARDVADAAGLFRELGDEWMLARLDWALATTLQRSGRVTEARERFLELVERYRANEDVWYEGLALGSLAWVCLALGDVREAFTWSVRSLRIAHRLRDVADMTLSLQEAALGAIAHGRPTDAAILVGAFEALCELHGIRPPAGLQITVGNVGDPAHRARAALGSEAYEEARARGASMSVEDAVAVVYDLAASLGLDA